MGVLIKKRKDGYYIEINDKRLVKNKRGRTSIKAGKTREAAEKVRDFWALKRQEARVKGTSLFEQERLSKPVPTLAQYFEESFKKGAHYKGGLRKSTQGIYNNAFDKFILPEFGSVPLNEIRLEQVKIFVGKIIDYTYSKKIKDDTGKKISVQCKLSKATIRITLACFAAVMNSAKEDDWIEKNPIRGREITKLYKQVKNRHEKIEPLTAEEVTLFLEAVLKHATAHYAILLCAVHTGMRAGEIKALKWENVKWKERILEVYASKTDKGRKIDISDALYAELQALHEKQKQHFLKRKRAIPELVFANNAGEQADMNNLRNRQFNRCLRHAGLRHIRFHDLRHTFATLLIMKGESLAYVRDQLGHSSIAMTVNCYTHWIPGSNRAAVNKLPAPERQSANNVLQLKTRKRS